MLAKVYPKFAPVSSEYVQSLLKAAESSTAGFNSKYASTPLAEKIKAAKVRFKPAAEPCVYWQDKQRELDG